MISRVHTFTLLGRRGLRRERRGGRRKPGLPAFSIVGLPDTAGARVARASARGDQELRLRVSRDAASSPASPRPTCARRARASISRSPPAILRFLGPAASGCARRLRDGGRARARRLGPCGARRDRHGRARGRTGASRRSSSQAQARPRLRCPRLLGRTPLPGRADRVPGGPGPDRRPPEEPSYSPPSSARTQRPRLQASTSTELRGQPVLRRALEAVAAGGHGMLILGPPGAGKSLAARRLPTIMPPLDDPEAMEVLRIASACGQNGWHANGRGPQPRQRPFRAPHHTISPGRPGRRRHTASRGRGDARAPRACSSLTSSASSRASRSRLSASRSRTAR